MAFHTLELVPPHAGAPSSVQRLPVSDHERQWIAELMRQQLKREDVPKNFPRCEFELPGHEPFFMDLKRLDTSAVIAWGRIANNQLRAVAVTAILSGIDSQEDDDAVDTVKNFKPKLPFFPADYKSINSQPRPLVATLYVELDVFKERLVALAAECAGAMFFRQFGDAIKMPPDKPRDDSTSTRPEEDRGAH